MSLVPTCLLPLLLIILLMPTGFSFILPNFIGPEALDALRISKKIGLFIKFLGIPNENLCQPSTDENFDPLFNEDLSFGDLLMEKEELEDTENEEEDGDTNDVERDFAGKGRSRRPKGKTSGKNSKGSKKPKKWVNGVIPYYISKDFNSQQKKKIKNAIEDLNSMVESVRFHPTRKSDKNYVMIFSGKGCYSKIGMIGGQQPVSLQADKCLKKGVVQHELMHVLGFRHEQNRPDRDDYVKILFKNIPQKWHNDYKRYNPSQAICIGSYDYYSVLHYPLEAPQSDDNKQALKVLDDNVDIQRIGSRDRMSEKDFEKAEELYDDE